MKSCHLMSGPQCGKYKFQEGKSRTFVSNTIRVDVCFQRGLDTLVYGICAIYEMDHRTQKSNIEIHFQPLITINHVYVVVLFWFCFHWLNFIFNAISKNNRRIKYKSRISLKQNIFFSFLYNFL